MTKVILILLAVLTLVPVNVAEESIWAQREAEAKDLEQFEGGFHVVLWIFVIVAVLSCGVVVCCHHW